MSNWDETLYIVIAIAFLWGMSKLFMWALGQLAVGC